MDTLHCWEGSIVLLGPVTLGGWGGGGGGGGGDRTLVWRPSRAHVRGSGNYEPTCGQSTHPSESHMRPVYTQWEEDNVEAMRHITLRVLCRRVHQLQWPRKLAAGLRYSDAAAEVCNTVTYLYLAHADYMYVTMHATWPKTLRAILDKCSCRLDIQAALQRTAGETIQLSFDNSRMRSLYQAEAIGASS